MFNNWFKKEKPIQGMMGFGGGAAGYLLGGAVGGGVEGTGGTVDDSTFSDYKVHYFTAPGSFSLNADGYIDIAVVGGGGGGGYNWGAGGGAGGVVVARDVPVTANTSMPVTIGNGGAGRANNPGTGSQGQHSSFGHPGGNFIGDGGGGGGCNDTNGGDGGSSGGGAYRRRSGTVTQNSLGNERPQPSYAGSVSNFGNFGGWGEPFDTSETSSTASAGHGGGGAGSAGLYGPQGRTTDSVGGNGGHGIDLSGLFGTAWSNYNGYVAAGGGGRGTVHQPHNNHPTGGGYGGYGGGGTSVGTYSAPVSNGAANTGSGGAGNSSSDNYAGSGGSGIVLVRYKSTNTATTYTSATGGNVITNGDYKYHFYFYTASAATFVVNSVGTDPTVDILVVGGGGGGSHPYGAGGGAGGVVYREAHTITQTTYNLYVANGGAAGGPNGGADNAPGENSVFGKSGPSAPFPADSLVALGGGRGGSNDSHAGHNGGSGGGSYGGPTTSLPGGFGLQQGPAPFVNHHSPDFIPDNSWRSGKGTMGGANGNPGTDGFGAGGGGGGATNVYRASLPSRTNNRGSNGWFVPKGFFPSPMVPWFGPQQPGKYFMGVSVPGSPNQLRAFAGGGGGGPGGVGGTGGGGTAGQAVSVSPDFGGQPSDPGGGRGARGAGGAGTNSGTPDHNGPGGTGCIIIKYKYQ